MEKSPEELRAKWKASRGPQAAALAMRSVGIDPKLAFLGAANRRRIEPRRTAQQLK